MSARTVPASRVLMIAMRQAEATHQAAQQEILAAALAESPELAGGKLDLATGLWSFPEEPQ